MAIAEIKASAKNYQSTLWGGTDSGGQECALKELIGQRKGWLEAGRAGTQVIL